MSGEFILGNGVVVTHFPSSRHAAPQIIHGGAVVWRDDRIVGVGAEVELRQQHAGATHLDAHGGLILPGLINLHHHFYSALALGLDPGIPLRNFTEVLDRLWWRLDRALDLECVRLAAEISAAECIRWGCTTVFDHHSSPACQPGSLDVIADVLMEHGLSGLMCNEVSDRNGHDAARAGIEENLRFIEKWANHPRIRGVVGLHASFTLRDETLDEVARRRPARSGCHIHLAEDLVDIQESLEAFGASPVERLERFGLLDAKCLLAHGIHLAPRDFESIAGQNAVLVHNPESNANNRVGRLDVEQASKAGCFIGLGTDGMSSAMLRGLRAAFLVHRAAQSESACARNAVNDLLFNNAQVARRFFDEPLLGELAPGAPPDIIVVDAPSSTPLGVENLPGHLVFGASEAPVRHTIARGRVLMEDFRHKTLDPSAIAARASAIAPALWQRFREMKWGTRFLGS